MFERKPTIDQPSHLSLGGMLCVHGHALELTAEEAVLTTSGQWLVLRVAHPEPALN